MAEPPTFVLDTFALIAYLRDEPAAARVERTLVDALEGRTRLLVSLINLGEILYIVERRGGVAKAQDTLALIRQLPLTILPADERSVFTAAHIKANHALSYADAFAVAVAIQEGAVILTGDPEFEAVESIVSVEWLEKSS